ncbi:MAG TPA: lytic transglycosylase domain-containing protein [Candidatus Eisenbergiella merdavium]|uniref:Lytic transglycosylase domain-containing protein n=1 Tax=Candidatus Eisenbergiella merdavium TaxID=2838551 RepID=A0A9D2NHN9_9FIRM|nr:lytic transglycosylase domain-containing protein [Candidatus Eisenbergiella merdavium]
MRVKILLIIAVVLFCQAGAGIRVQAEECIVPDSILEISNEIGKEYNICPELLQSIAFQESRFQADAQNGGCTGLMQVNPAWHGDRMRELSVTDLYDPEQNMEVAADYLRELFERYEDVGTVLMVYHGEAGAVNKIEPSQYADEILERSAALERLHGK